MTHLFISDEEFSRCSNDAALLAEKADAFIRGLYNELETVKAQADAANITAEQTCSLLEQKYLSLSAEFSKLESHNAQLQSSLDHRLSELAEVQAQKHQLNLLSIGKAGEIERLKTELSEMQKTKRELVHLVEHKDLDISEKNATIKSYLDRIVGCSDTAAQREARLSEIEAELVRSQAARARLLQEKELIDRHNVWLNDELTAKVDSLIQLRRTHLDLEADMSNKLAEVQRRYDECSSSLQWNKERVRELEMKLTSLQEELCSSKETATANEERLSAELSTVNKLVELYKESSEEWSRKANELEGVIKALEIHLSQVETDSKERLEKEESMRKKFEKEAADLKIKLAKCEADLETCRKKNELNLLPPSNFTADTWINTLEIDNHVGDNQLVAPKIPVGVSGTALAASLLRDGWSLAKMYAKYQESADALRHEQLGRKEAEAVLQRVLYELEEKAEVILEERVEHERIAEAYSMIDQKLQHSISEQANLEKTIQDLKADLRRHERNYALAQKENDDLHKQVTVLLKECRDIQVRCGSSGRESLDSGLTITPFEMNAESDAEKVISEHLLTFKDINGLVEQNVELRTLVRSLSDQLASREQEFKEKLEMELKRHMDEAASKVAAVLQRAEEQGIMIDSLHTSVAMYKRLYEEEHKRNLSSPHPAEAAEAAPAVVRTDLKFLLQGSQETTRMAQEQAAERLRCLEEDLAKSRSEIISLRSERDKLDLEAKFARDKLDSFVKEFDHQRAEMNGVLARNVEFSQLIIDYQRKVRESSESLHVAEELSRKLTMEVSVFKNEKEMLLNAEKRAHDEVRSLSERVHRLQASLDTIQSAEEVREEARMAERKRQEDYAKHLEREWAEAKKELQEERDTARGLSFDRDRTINNALKQFEDMGKELANALHAVAAAESRAAIAEAKLTDLEKKIKSSNVQVVEVHAESGPSLFSNYDVSELRSAMEEIAKFKEEAQTNKDHMLQYKNIAQVNEDALKQVEYDHENYKIEAEKLKKSLESELLSLRARVSELEDESILKSKEVASAASATEEALASSLREITSLKEECAIKSSNIERMDLQISNFREELEREHQRWRDAHANYERQVILQSETIQELKKTSQALASLQEEAANLRKSAYAYESENKELKTKWEAEKAVLEESKNGAEKKYNELNEQNKLLHSRLEALHIKLAENERKSAGISSVSATTDSHGEADLQNVIGYLRRTKEIAETEISLLKQEKLRLQSQLESALKAAETAQASVVAERANSRRLLFTEEEIKSLQLQLREMNLLRESNMQLREENKHNYEECQKLREVAQKAVDETENLESMLREKQMEVESCKLEIEKEKMEKHHLENRISELLERSKDVDVEDYNHLKDDVQKMQDELKEKDAQLEKINKLLSERQDVISQLEQDLSSCRAVLNEREKKLHETLQVETSLKLDVEKQKKVLSQFKRKIEIFSKEKEELIKENQALSRQLEDIKQGKRPGADTTGEQAMKEEKDAKIQILEKHLERHREELKKEKEDNRTEKNRRLKIEKAIKDSYSTVEQEKTKFINELEKQRRSVKQLSDELEKLKHAKSNLPEGTSLVQILSGTILDDLASAYVLAVENFEKAAQSVLTELDANGAPSDTSISVDTPLPPTAGPAVHNQAPGGVSSMDTATIHLPGKAAEESEKRLTVLKTNVETRKAGRKLVRPRLVKLGEPQGDVEMSEMEASASGGKSTLSSEAEVRGNLASSQQVRKRLASTTSESHEHLAIPGEISAEVAAPVMKKSKGSDSVSEGAEGQATTLLESLETQPATEGASEVYEMPQILNEEAFYAEKEETEMDREKAEEPKEQLLYDQAPSQVELQSDKNNTHEDSDKTVGGEVPLDDVLKDQAEADNWQLATETGNEREEGELLPDVPELDGGGNSESPEIGEDQSELAATPSASPARVEDETLAVEVGEMNSPEVPNEEKDDGDVTEDTAEGLEKLNDGNEQVVDVAEATPVTGDNISTSTASEVSVTRRGRSSLSPASNTSTTINLQERARERAMLRQAGVVSSSSLGRGRGRAVRGRGVRGGRSVRGGRGQPGEQ